MTLEPWVGKILRCTKCDRKVAEGAQHECEVSNG